jgi:alpha-mannosidase
MQVDAHTGDLPTEKSFVSVDGDNVVLAAMKKAEDSNALLFHLYEWAGKDDSITMTVPAGAIGVTETNLMETPEGSALRLEGSRMAVPVHPYEIFAVEVAYPESATAKSDKH